MTCRVCDSSVAGFKDSEVTTCYECEHFPSRLADHGISPAQLREKVEALEKRIADVAHVAASVSGLYDDVWTRLDAALKRIEQLERVIGMSARQNQVDISKRPIAPIDEEDV